MENKRGSLAFSDFIWNNLEILKDYISKIPSKNKETYIDCINNFCMLI